MTGPGPTVRMDSEDILYLAVVLVFFTSLTIVAVSDDRAKESAYRECVERHEPDDCRSLEP